MSAGIAFNHEMLVANAGSGKTYALTTRMIRLMLAGVAIEKIAALTFTRKSAGEFLDALLLRIADAAIEPAQLAALAADTGRPSLSVEDCCDLLRQIVDHFGELGLGTIDSFFARIVRQFPLESGLPEDFAIADNARLNSARERALAATFTQSVSGADGLQAMIEQCRQIARRQGERNVFATLLNQAASLHQRYLESPPGCRWGDAAAIWGDSPPFTRAADFPAAIDAFGQAVREAKPELSDEGLENLQAGLDELRSFEPGHAWSETLKKFIDQKLASEPKDGHLRFGAKKAESWVKLTPALEAARKTLLQALYADALDQALERSCSLYAFMQTYESVYAAIVRRAGLISFADITASLAERADDRNTDDALDWRTQVAYRIDQRFDHWLLDEFQDTSRQQWAILRCFIEEVVMDDAAQRSFFYVGDTKQAIYGWRGGDAELFREIFEHYSSIKAADPLTQSWRSTTPVIEMVNTLFGGLTALADELKLPEATLRKWELAWNAHEVAPPRRDRTGYATWRPVEPDPEAEEEAQHAAVLAILREVDPIAHDKECAVLLRKNDAVAELAAYLQTQGIPVAVEGKSNPCTDNALGSAILAALRTAAHPGDTLAAAVARGLPCARAWGLDDPAAFREHTLQSLAEDGYAATLQNWVELAALGENEAFLRARSEALLAAAENFDVSASHSDGIDAFIATVEALELQEAEARDAIRIMTVHQAKGLGFDMVIVCGLDQSGRNATTDELVLGPDKRRPQWGLLMPRKEIAEKDPLLNALREQAEAEARTGELCGAYVALTRAKQALYVISDALKDKSSTTHFGRHLQLALGEGWEAGDPQWYRSASSV